MSRGFLSDDIRRAAERDALRAAARDAEPFKINGRIVERGTELSVAGERGRFRFLYLNPSDGSLTCYGGVQGHEMFRAFRVERVRTVHSKSKTRGNADN